MPDKPEDATDSALTFLSEDSIAVLVRSLAEAFRDVVERAKVAPEKSPHSATLVTANGPAWLAPVLDSEADESLPEGDEKETSIGARLLREALPESETLAIEPRSASRFSREPSITPDRSLPIGSITAAERPDLIPSRDRPIGVPPWAGPTVRESDPLPTSDEIVPVTSRGGSTPVTSEYTARPDRPAPSNSPWTPTTISPPAPQADFGLVATAPRVAFEAWGPSRTSTGPEPGEIELKGFIPLSAPPTRNWPGINEGPSIVPAHGEGSFIESQTRPVMAVSGREPEPDLEGSIERILSLLGEVLKTQRNHLPTARRPSRST